MLIAVAADLHDNRNNWQKFNDYAAKQGISTLLFCGDLACADTLDLVMEQFQGEIYIIAGNAETYNEKRLIGKENFHFLGRYGDLSIGGRLIGLIHEPRFKEELLSSGKDFEYIFYGHTHKPWIEHTEGYIYANPGTLGGIYYQPTFAVLDTESGKLSLVLLDQI